jgi:elongation factor P
MANTSDLSKGVFIRFNNELVVVTEIEHRTPGNLRAFYQAKMRNVKTGKFVEYRFRSGEEVILVRVDVKEMQYLYKDGESLVLMDTETFEQVYISGLLFGDSLQFLKEEMNVKISFDDTTPVYAEPPNTVELEITYTEPGIKGDTATKTLKKATMETGAIVSVPLFVEIGEKIKIDTRNGEYMERVK